MQNDGGRLRAARESLGWSQSRAAKELAALAERRGHEAASPASLKTQLSRWENQHVIPEGGYRTLLSELYGWTESELGLAAQPSGTDVDEATRLRADLALAAGLDDAGIELLEAQLASTNALDRKLGPAAVAESLDAQLSHLERLITHALRPDVRRRLAGLVGSASILAGRAQAERARPAGAWGNLERALQIGHATGDRYLACWALVEQASVLIDIGRPSDAVDLLGVARAHLPSGVDPLFSAWLDTNLGTAHAAAGAARQARSAYRAAERALGEAPASAPLQVDTGRPAGVCVEFGQAAFHRQRGRGLHALRADSDAIDDLQRALAGGGSARDLAAVHVDLAHAFDATGDASSAASHGRTARELAGRIGSARLSARLDAGGRTDGHPVSRG